MSLPTSAGLFLPSQRRANFDGRTPPLEHAATEALGAAETKDACGEPKEHGKRREAVSVPRSTNSVIHWPCRMPCVAGSGRQAPGGRHWAPRAKVETPAGAKKSVWRVAESTRHTGKEEDERNKGDNEKKKTRRAAPCDSLSSFPRRRSMYKELRPFSSPIEVCTACLP